MALLTKSEEKALQKKIFLASSPLKAAKVSLMTTQRFFGSESCLLFDKLPDPMWLFDPDSLRFLDANEAALHKLGYTREELREKTIKDIRPKEEIPALLETLQALKDDELHAGVWRIQTRDGSVFYANFQWRILERQGKRGVLASARDITALLKTKEQNDALLEEQKRLKQEAEASAAYFQTANERLEEQAAYLRTTERLLGLGIWKYNIDTNRLIWLNNVHKLYGRPEDEDINNVAQYTDLVHPEDREHMVDNLTRYLAAPTRYFHFQHRILRSDGSVAYVKGLGELTQTSEGQVITGVVQDITAEVQGAYELTKATHLLRIAGRKAHLGGWRVDLKKNWVDWTEETAAIHEKEGTLRLSIEEAIAFYAPEYRERLKLLYNRCLRLGEPYDDTFQIITATGKRIWVRSIGEAEYDEKGEIVAVHGAFQDITEKRNLEERLHQAQKLESVGHLTGGVAHDFNNLLTVIIGNTEMLMERLEGRPVLREMAEMAASAASRGAELTHRLLAFARRQALEPKQIDVNRLLANMETLLRRTLHEDIDIETIWASDLWTAEIDPAQLESAILNLAINARDAMPSGGKLTIETANAVLDESYATKHQEVQAGEYIAISISDSGSGMTPEVLKQAFEPFFTTKQTGKGSGLGLSMVYGFVKQSGGHIKIYSEVGEGTTIKLYFPRAITASQNTTQPKLAEETQSGKEHILLVEDDISVRQYVTLLLKDLGYRVTSAENGIQALEIIQQTEDIELLFTDIVMPGGLNGRQLAEKALALRPHLKVLYTSGYTENAIVHHGRLDRGVELLSKPYRRQDLAEKVRKVLDAPKDKI